MERDPLRFVWRTSPALNLLAILLLVLLLPLAFAGLELVRTAVDDAIGGQAFRSGATAPFLPFVLRLPEQIVEEPITLFAGWPLTRPDFVLATVAALGALALVAGLAALILGALRTAIAARALAALRRAVLGTLVSARPSARDEARQAGALAGEIAAREGGLLGSALIQPTLTGGSIGLAIAYGLVVDPWLALAVAAGLALAGAAWPGRAIAQQRATEARVAEGAALRRGLSDLVRRLPALRAHGTGPAESARLTADLDRRHAGVRGAERRQALASALTALAAVLAPALVLGTGAWLAMQGRVTPGEIVATTVAVLGAVVALAALMRWRRTLIALRALFEEAARSLGGLQSRRASGRTEAQKMLPGAGALVAQGVSAYDPSTGARVTGLDVAIAFPAHVALVGEPNAGPKIVAALLAGQLDPSMGRLTFAGVDLMAVPPPERARRIAYAGGDTILLGASLRDNLLYGHPAPDSPDVEASLAEAVTVAGLDELVHARGLSGTVDPTRDPKLAQAVVEARRAVRAALAAEGAGGFIDPFDPGAYNRHATVAENILFGMPVGDTFRDANLPAHPFVRAILEAEGLTKPLAAMGLSIATSMIEIFADVPDGHPLFERFSFFTASERGYYEDLVERQTERRRGAEPGRDRERLISLGLRYIESRHRLGLLDEAMEARLLQARGAFAKLLPTSLQPSIEFYDPERLCAAASLQDNLLFGRIAHDRAGAEATVRRVVRRVLAERGLDRDVLRVGLATRIDTRGDTLSLAEVAAIDLARCLARRPDIVVAEGALQNLIGDPALGLVQRLRRALVGRGLVLAMPELRPEMDRPPFDLVLRFERGAIAALEDRRRPSAAAEPPARAAVGL
ncbi:MAG TPA: ABC transporter ATP-binding protein [Beijerinckiaceae bacterium]|jgi:ABC-type multidrug transport system fused ATPase/permease subunit